MSEPLRIAVAVEGPTDAIVIGAILDGLLPDTDFVFQTLQPEGSSAFDTGTSGETGVGWVGVYRWCRQSASEGGGSVSGSSVLSFHNVLIIQVDADVAGTNYCSGSIRDAPRNDLPCENPVRHQIELRMPCDRLCSTGSANLSVLRRWYYARLPRISRLGWLLPSGPTIPWSNATTGNANLTRGLN